MSKDIYRTYSIYKITNSFNGRSYVGQTKEPPARRFNSHCRNEFPSSIGNAIQEHGKKNFDFEILHEFKNVRHPTRKEKTLRSKLRKKYKCSGLTLMTREELLLNFAEIFWIAVHDTNENGYNNTAGGNSSNQNRGWKGVPVWTDVLKEQWANSDESKQGPWVSRDMNKDCHKAYALRSWTNSLYYPICDRWMERGNGFSRFYYECWKKKPKGIVKLLPIDSSKPIGPDNFQWLDSRQVDGERIRKEWEKSYGKPWIFPEDAHKAHVLYDTVRVRRQLSEEWDEYKYGWQRFYWECYPFHSPQKCLISTDGSPVIGKDNFKWVSKAEVRVWNKSLPKEASAA